MKKEKKTYLGLGLGTVGISKAVLTVLAGGTGGTDYKTQSGAEHEYIVAKVSDRPVAFFPLGFDAPGRCDPFFLCSLIYSLRLATANQVFHSVLTHTQPLYTNTLFLELYLTRHITSLNPKTPLVDRCLPHPCVLVVGLLVAR